MRLRQPANRYLVGVTVHHWRVLAAQSSPPKELPVNLAALLMRAAEFALVCDPIHESKENA